MHGETGDSVAVWKFMCLLLVGTFLVDFSLAPIKDTCGAECWCCRLEARRSAASRNFPRELQHRTNQETFGTDSEGRDGRHTKERGQKGNQEPQQ